MKKIILIGVGLATVSAYAAVRKALNRPFPTGLGDYDENYFGSSEPEDNPTQEEVLVN